MAYICSAEIYFEITQNEIVHKNVSCKKSISKQYFEQLKRIYFCMIENVQKFHFEINFQKMQNLLLSDS